MNNDDSADILIDRLINGSPDDPDAGWKAAIALGDLPSPQDRQRAVTALIDALNSGRAHALTRSHAVESLGKLADPRAIPALVAALNDPYRLVRAYAIMPLVNVSQGNENLDLLLQALESDEFFGVRASAACALAQLSARQDDPAARQRVREALARQRAAELASPEPGSERVVSEIDRSLAILG